jgi:hypothetical protein
LKGFQTWIKERMTDQTIEFKEVGFTEPELKVKKTKEEGKGEKETMTKGDVDKKKMREERKAKQAERKAAKA